MNREQKTEFIQELHERFRASPFLVLTDFAGVTVAQLQSVRKAAAPAGATYQVVKNTLARRAVEGTDKSALKDHFKGNIGVIISGDDLVATAKMVKQTAKDTEKFVIKGGILEGEVLTPDQVVAIADMPSKEDLLSSLLATLQAGPQQAVSVIQAPIRDLLYLLSNRASQLESVEG